MWLQVAVACYMQLLKQSAADYIKKFDLSSHVSYTMSNFAFHDNTLDDLLVCDAHNSHNFPVAKLTCTFKNFDKRFLACLLCFTPSPFLLLSIFCPVLVSSLFPHKSSCGSNIAVKFPQNYLSACSRTTPWKMWCLILMYPRDVIVIRQSMTPLSDFSSHSVFSVVYVIFYCRIY